MSVKYNKVNHNNKPPLNGLVLAGGKSVRMGKDKGLLKWHGKAQRYFLADMLATYCEQVFISCRSEQAEDISVAGYKALLDKDIAKGQYRAILTALNTYPKNAWLVVACDLPLFDVKAVTQLIEQRDPSFLATAYSNEINGLPEPLAAIWEPCSQDMLLQILAKGITCPRKALIRSNPDVKLVKPQDPQVIINVNTPEAAERVRLLIKSTKATSHVE